MAGVSDDVIACAGKYDVTVFLNIRSGWFIMYVYIRYGFLVSFADLKAKTECVNVLCTPRVIDLPSNDDVISVSCGSRHTAIITGFLSLLESLYV